MNGNAVHFIFVKSFTISLAIISPAVAGTKALLPKMLSEEELKEIINS